MPVESDIHIMDNQVQFSPDQLQRENSNKNGQSISALNPIYDRNCGMDEEKTGRADSPPNSESRPIILEMNIILKIMGVWNPLVNNTPSKQSDQQYTCLTNSATTKNEMQNRKSVQHWWFYIWLIFSSLAMVFTLLSSLPVVMCSLDTENKLFMESPDKKILCSSQQTVKFVYYAIVHFLVYANFFKAALWLRSFTRQYQIHGIEYTTGKIRPLMFVMAFYCVYFIIDVCDCAIDCASFQKLRADLWPIRISNSSVKYEMTLAGCYGYTLGINIVSYIPCLTYISAALLVLQYTKTKAAHILIFSERIDKRQYTPKQALDVIMNHFFWNRTPALMKVEFIVLRFMYVGSLAIAVYAHIFLSGKLDSFVTWVRHALQILKIAAIFLPPWYLVAYGCIKLESAYNDLSKAVINAMHEDQRTFGNDRTIWSHVRGALSGSAGRTTGYYSHFHGISFTKSWILTVTGGTFWYVIWKMVEHLNHITDSNQTGTATPHFINCERFTSAITCFLLIGLCCLYSVYFVVRGLRSSPKANKVKTNTKRKTYIAMVVAFICYLLVVGLLPLLLFASMCPNPSDCACEKEDISTIE